MHLRPTNSDRQGQWWNTGHVFQDRSSAKAKIQLLEYMLIVIYEAMKRYCAASLSYLFIVMLHSTSLYCSYLMNSFHHSCVGNQTVLWKWNKMEKVIQARLLCLSLSRSSILDSQWWIGKRRWFLTLQFSWNLHFQALGKQLLKDSCKPRNVTQKTLGRWGRKESYEGGHRTQLKNSHQEQGDEQTVFPSSQHTLSQQAASQLSWIQAGSTWEFLTAQQWLSASL